MDKTNNSKASDFERRASRRTSIRLSVMGSDENHGIAPFATDNETSAGDDALSSGPASFDGPSTTASTLQVLDSTISRRTSLLRPSSIAKPPHPNSDSIVSRAERSQPSTTGVLLPSSNGSAQPPALWQESPYRGPSGPSFPYAMYPQRTLSMATASTEPAPDRSYEGPTGPAHPYGLYNQSTESSDQVQTQHIPVGFLGSQSSYQRQIGSEGEEVGALIGPLGHTEELPPYSRYPDASYASKSSDAAPQAPAPIAALPVVGASVVPQPTSVQAIPGAGGIGLATRNPEFASTDDLDTPATRLSTRSFTSDSNHEINTAARTVTEKPTEGKWHARAKKKLCGIVPYWAICLLVVGIAVMGIILGSVIGVFLARHKRPPFHHGDDAEPQTSPTPTADVQPLHTVPPDLPMLTTGVFSLPPLVTSQAPNLCFNISTQAQAWTCGVGFTYYFLQIDRLPDYPPTSQFTLKLTTPSNNGSATPQLTWGMRPPLIPDPIQLNLVNDTAEPYLGPAWWMQMTYNKTVVLSESKFPGPNTSASSSTPPSSVSSASAVTKRAAKKRWGFPPSGSDGFKRKGLAGAQPGDKPWICTWPGTILEAFIYPSQNNSWKPPFPMGPPTSSLATPTGALLPSTPPSRPTAPVQNAGSTTQPWPPPRTSSTSSAASPDWTLQAPPPVYPKIIKFEERRYPGSGPTRASCQQVRVSDDGSYTPALDGNGQPIEVFIIENNDDAQPAPSSRRWVEEIDLQYRDVQPADQLTDCGCTWWFT